MNFINKAALRGSTSVCAAIAAMTVFSAPAYAQDGTAATAVDCPDDNQDGVCDPITTNADGTTTADTGAIVVTGSRIKSSNYNSPSPLQVLTRDDSTIAGFNSTNEVLQSTGVTAGARQIDNTYTGFITDGGPGANTLSLRSLGTARTLILLNGRRLAPSGTSGSLLSASHPRSSMSTIATPSQGACGVTGLPS